MIFVNGLTLTLQFVFHNIISTSHFGYSLEAVGRLPSRVQIRDHPRLGKPGPGVVRAVTSSVLGVRDGRRFWETDTDTD